MLVCSEASFRIDFSHRVLALKSKTPAPQACAVGTGELKKSQFLSGPRQDPDPPREASREFSGFWIVFVSMILPQVHLRKPCYDFSFL